MQKVKEILRDIEQKALEGERLAGRVERLEKLILQIRHLVEGVEIKEKNNTEKLTGNKQHRIMTGLNYDEAAVKWYQVVMNGTKVTIPMLHKAHPRWSRSSIIYLWTTLKKMKGVSAIKLRGESKFLVKKE